MKEKVLPEGKGWASQPNMPNRALLKTSAVVLLAAGVTWGALTENPAEENFKE